MCLAWEHDSPKLPKFVFHNEFSWFSSLNFHIFVSLTFVIEVPIISLFLLDNFFSNMSWNLVFALEKPKTHGSKDLDGHSHICPNFSGQLRTPNFYSATSYFLRIFCYERIKIFVSGIGIVVTWKWSKKHWFWRL